MPTSAMTNFRTRKDEEGNELDSRQFDTWYYPDETNVILGIYYKQLDPVVKKLVVAPLVLYHFEPQQLKNVIRTLIDLLGKSKKQYFPFMFAPEAGGAHYMAGMLQREGDNIRLIIFNPVGHIDRLNFGELKDEIEIISSPHKIQSFEKDGDKLVSCGPICVEFIQYAMTHLKQIDALDKRFKLDDSFLNPLESKQYKTSVMGFRSQHDSMLEKLTDAEEAAIVDERAQTLGPFLDTFRQLCQEEEAMNAEEYYYYEDVVEDEEDEEDEENQENSSLTERETPSSSKPIILDEAKQQEESISTEFDKKLNEFELKIKNILDKASSSSEKTQALDSIRIDLLRIIGDYRDAKDAAKFKEEFTKALHTNDRTLRVHLNPIKRLFQAFLDLFRKDKSISSYSVFATKSANKIAEIDEAVREIACSKNKQ